MRACNTYERYAFKKRGSGIVHRDLSSVISRRTGAEGYARPKSSLLSAVQRIGLAANPLAGAEVRVRANTRTLRQGLWTGRALRAYH